MRKLWLGCAALAFVLFAMPAVAQETRGSIEGTIKDSTGGVLPGVTITATSTGGVSQSTVSDARGVYRFPAVVPGTYVVKSALSGFNEAKVEAVLVTIGNALTINLTLTPTGVAESLTVTAAMPVVDVKQSAVTQVVTADTIDLIPKTGTGILGALSGLPGAGSEGRLGGFGIDGAGASENRYLIDGMDVSNLQTGVLGRDLNITFIDSIQVKQSGYAAEFRASTGGVISAVTRSGTNRFHGGVNTFISGRPVRGLLGNVRPTLQLVPSDESKAEYITVPRLNESTNINPSYDIGGPIVQNRLWFFVGYNPRFENTDRNVIWTTPAAYAGTTQVFNAKSTTNSGLYNITAQLSTDKRLRFSGSNDRSTGALALPTISSSTGQSTQNAATFNPRASTYTASFADTYSASYDWTTSATTFVNISGGYFGNGSHTAGGDYYHGVRRVFGASNINLLDVPANLQQANGFADNLPNTFNEQNDFSRFSLNGEFTQFFNWKGQHSVKFGAQWERFGNVVDNGQQFPNVSLRWDSSRATLDSRSVRGKYGYYIVTRSYTTGNIHSNNVGLFAQDQWTVNPKLTLNYGLRVDQTNIPSFRDENAGIKFGFGDKISPRVGFAYDLKGDGKWKAYGSWGVFYDIEKLEMPLGSFGANNWIDYYWTLDNANWPAIDCDGLPTSNCPGTFIEQVDFRHVSNGQGADNLVDPDLKPYKTQEITFGLDHQLSRTISVGTRWAHKWLNEAIEDIGVQVFGIGEVFYIANPGRGLGEYPLGRDYPATPRPERVYDGLEFTFKRRLQNNWMLNSSLVLSNIRGTFSGLTSSDENGRNSPSVNRFYDGLFMSFDQTGKVLDGRLQSDRPWVFKLQPAYRLPWGTMAGAEIDVMAGLPYTSSITFTGVPVYMFGRNDLGRVPTRSFVHLNFQQELRMPKNMRAAISFNIENLFDQMTVTSVANAPYRDALVFTQCSNATCANNAFFAGFDAAAIQAARNAANPAQGRRDPRWKQANGWEGARSARLQVKFTF
jgi:outer membrane receptor protein involved in Fe transport